MTSPRRRPPITVWIGMSENRILNMQAHIDEAGVGGTEYDQPRAAKPSPTSVRYARPSNRRLSPRSTFEFFRLRWSSRMS